MSAIDRLVPVALLGTERSAEIPAVIRNADAALGALLESIAASAAGEPQSALLRAAGVLAQIQRVGFLPRPASDAPPPDAPPIDDAPALASEDWLMRLERVLADGPVALQHEAFSTLARHGYRLHAKLLPAALDLALAQPRLREIIAAVLGHRGHWLAQQRERWQGALAAPASPTEDDWSHGRLTARVAYLRHERSTEPARARERLAQELPQQGADERAELVACLDVGLASDDEAILDSLLVDRAAPVRRTAARLFLRLPQSARTRAITAALGELVRKSDKGSWAIDAPAAEMPESKALGLEPRPKNDELGERAHWLLQLVRNAPLSFWGAHTGMTPDELIAWAAKTDWSVALVRGIHDALLAAPEDTWALALLGGWNGKALGHFTEHVQALLPWAVRERIWQARLAAEGNEVLPLVAQEVMRVAAPGERLGVGLARLVASHLAGLLGTHDSLFGAAGREGVASLVAAMPDTALESLRAIVRQDDLMSQLEETAVRVEGIVDLRLRLSSLAAASACPPV